MVERSTHHVNRVRRKEKKKKISCVLVSSLRVGSNPLENNRQGRIIIKPVTCPQVGRSKIGDHILIRYLRHFLDQKG